MKKLIYILLLIPFIVEAQYRALVRPDIIIKHDFIYDVRAYGAIVDDGNTDITAIQAAIDSCASQGGGTVYFPPGVYEIGFNDTIQVHSNTVIKGAGIGATKFNYTKTSGDSSIGKPAFIIADADSNIVFCDFEIDGNATYAVSGAYGEYDAGILLYHNDCKRIWIERLYIHDTAGDAIEVNRGNDVYISDCRIDVQLIRSSAPLIGRNGISGLQVDGLFINNCIISGNGLPGNIDIEPAENQTAKNIIISNNKLSEGFYGIGLNGNASGAALDSVLVHHNIIFNTDSTAIQTFSMTNAIISDNIIGSADGHGIECRPNQSKYVITRNEIHNCAKTGILIGQTTTDVEISENRCYENGFYGIRIAGSTGSDRNKRFLIRDNVTWNNDSEGTSSYDGININYTDSSLVTGNLSYDNQSSPTQVYGFVFASSTNLVVAFDNTGFGNKTGLVSLSALTVNNLGMPYNTGERLLFNRGASGAADDELIFLYDADFASIAIQSGGGSRFWVAADTTTGSSFRLLIGADGNTTPAVSNYPLVLSANQSVTLSDSVRVGSGAWIRKQFWSITGDSLGIISYNTVSSKLDTAWAVTK